MLFRSNSADGLLQLINDILNFSRAERVALQLERAPFALRECVQFAVDTVNNLAEEKALQLTWSVDKAVANYYAGDAGRLRQVLINLLGNAIKFTRVGSVRVEVEVVESNAQSDALRFTVADTGIGIPVDKQSIVFEAFTQVDTSMTREFSGTGLGLAICKRLVESWGGTILAESGQVDGTTVIIEVLRAAHKPEEHSA